MRYPDFLHKGGTIGFAAPSFGCAAEPYKTAFEMAIRKFTDMGYKTALGPNCYEGSGIGISSTPQSCGAELTAMYESNKNDVLISCGGGELMCETIANVDFDRIRAAKPKWFLGYSDNTNFTFLQNTLCDTAAIYGPCAGAFAMPVWHESIADTFDVLCGVDATLKSTGITSSDGKSTGNLSSDGTSSGTRDMRIAEIDVHGYETWERESLKNEDNPAPGYNLTEKKVLKSYIGEREAGKDEEIAFAGRIVGGCMDCLVNLTGTRFDKVKDFNARYADEGIIWFLESCDLNVFAIRRAMWQMENAGWFDNVKGFLIGRPLCFGQEMMGLDQYRAILGTASRYGVPVIMDCDLGHLPPSMPIISGAHGEVSVKDDKLEIRYSLI